MRMVITKSVGQNNIPCILFDVLEREKHIFTSFSDIKTGDIVLSVINGNIIDNIFDNVSPRSVIEKKEYLKFLKSGKSCDYFYQFHTESQFKKLLNLDENYMLFLNAIIRYVFCYLPNSKLNDYPVISKFSAFTALKEFDYKYLDFTLRGWVGTIFKNSLSEKEIDERLKLFKKLATSDNIEENILKTMELSKKHSLVPTTDIQFKDFREFLAYEIFEMVKNNTIVKICKNCDRYFLPSCRSDELYCDKISPQYNNKTCKEAVKYEKQLERERSNEAGKIYKSIYTMKLNKYNYSKSLELEKKHNRELKSFMKAAAIWKADVKTGAKTESEYIKWLNSFKKRGINNGNNTKKG